MYFSCIMFMVSSSCITTILILNYHHRYHLDFTINPIIIFTINPIPAV